jgi:ATP sulfurylase
MKKSQLRQIIREEIKGGKMYTREEVATLIRRAFAGVEGKYIIQVPLQINKWIDQNV